jgi:hypothetical protein
MAAPNPPLVFFAPDIQERAVWVVVDPRDFVTGRRMTAPVRVRLEDVDAEPIQGRSGVYCFTDLQLPAGPHRAVVEPQRADRARYFDGEATFALAVVPVAGQPLQRNRVQVDLFPRPGYPFAGATLARGRLVKASDASPVDGARAALIRDAVDLGVRGRTDERGEFVVFFPPAPPEDTATAGLADYGFQVRFEIDGQPPHLIAQQTVREGSTFSHGEIAFPGI